jgi:hypothetical protein
MILISLGNWTKACIFIAMKNLTKQEQFVLCMILLLVLTGWAVKVYRTAHAPMTPQHAARIVNYAIA